MPITINFDEKTATQLDLDGDGEIDHATVVADISDDGKSITGKVYVALAADGFSKDKLVTREFSRQLDTECKDISTQGQKLFFSCGAQTMDAEAIVKDKYAESKEAKVMTKEILEKEIAENAGILGRLRDDATLDSALGATGLNEDMMKGIGGLIGAKGTQIGSGGLRNPDLDGGGTAEGLGGLGTKGRGPGASGYGTGGGSFGSKGEGGIGPIGGDPVILGSMDKSLIDAVIKRAMSQFRYVYQRELETYPDLSGKVTIRFVIASDGSVSKAEVKTEKTHWNHVEVGAEVGKRICDRFLNLQFPEPQGGAIVVVSYPFIFSPG